MIKLKPSKDFDGSYFVRNTQTDYIVQIRIKWKMAYHCSLSELNGRTVSGSMGTILIFLLQSYWQEMLNRLQWLITAQNTKSSCLQKMKTVTDLTCNTWKWYNKGKVKITVKSKNGRKRECSWREKREQMRRKRKRGRDFLKEVKGQGNGFGCVLGFGSSSVASEGCLRRGLSWARLSVSL